jgi:hypothetical protein
MSLITLTKGLFTTVDDDLADAYVQALTDFNLTLIGVSK